MNVIECNHIYKSFGTFSIEDLNLSVPMGMICGLVGENGAGKSTTIRLLMGALRPESGEARILGVNSLSTQFKTVKEEIGIVLDEAYFPENLNAMQINNIMKDTYNRWDTTLFKNWLERFDLPRKKAFKDYSRGMRMKLAIAVALSHAPKLLILDEPTAGLDPIIRDEILDIFYDFTRQEDHSILISSHILSDLEKLCDMIAFLHQGKLIFCEEKDLLLEKYGIFTGTAEQVENLRHEAIIGQEKSVYGGIRVLVKRDEVPKIFELERPTIEDIILFTSKNLKSANYEEKEKK